MSGANRRRPAPAAVAEDAVGQRRTRPLWPPMVLINELSLRLVRIEGLPEIRHPSQQCSPTRFWVRARRDTKFTCPCRIFGTYSGRCSCGPETATVPRVG
jgi:hypothetical protein